MAKIYRVHVHDHADQGRWLASADWTGSRPSRDVLTARLPVLDKPGRYEVRINRVEGENEYHLASWLQGDPPAPNICEHCGCKLGTTVATGLDSSLAFTALLEMWPQPLYEPQASELRSRLVEDWRGSGHLDFWAYAREWVDRERCICTAPPTAPGNAMIIDRRCPVHGRPAEPSYGPNADGNPYAQYTPESRVWAIAQTHGKAAASWVVDGSTSAVSARGLVKGIEDGDPAVLDSIREPGLSGEYGGDYPEDQLMTDAGWVPHDGTDLRDELASQYNREVSGAFWDEVERLARNQIPEPEAREGDQ
jgi:hypothetical protein